MAKKKECPSESTGREEGRYDSELKIENERKIVDIPHPEGWTFDVISTIAEVNPATDITNLTPDTSVTFLAMADIGENGHILSRQTRKLKDVRNGFSLFKENDVLFPKITPCMENGKGAIANHLVNGIGFGSTEFHVLRAKEDQSVEFLYQLSRAPKIRNQARRYMTGSAGQLRVSADFFSHYKIPIPPPLEGQKIATILNTVDATLAETDAIIEQMERLKTGLIHDLLTPGIREGSENWEYCQLEDVCDRAFNGGTPSTKVTKYWQGSIPWITGADIINQKVGFIRRYITDEAVQNSSTHVIPKGNLLLVTRTGIGKMAIAPFDIAISQDITGFIPNKRINPVHLFWLLQTPIYQKHFQALNQGTSINGVKRKDWMSLKIPLPNLEEQNTIVSVISTLDNDIDLERQYKTTLERTKNGLMQNLLTGKVPVNVGGSAHA